MMGIAEKSCVKDQSVSERDKLMAMNALKIFIIYFQTK